MVGEIPLFQCGIEMGSPVHIVVSTTKRDARVHSVKWEKVKYSGHKVYLANFPFTFCRPPFFGSEWVLENENFRCQFQGSAWVGRPSHKASAL